MTGTTRYKATFKDLAAVVKLSYEGMRWGRLVIHLPRLRAYVIACFRHPEMPEYGRRGILRRLPKVILQILRHTIVPTVEWDDSALKWPSKEIVNAVLSIEPINLLDWMVNQMMECKRNVDAPLILQLYIMALVLRIVKDFHGVYETSHGVYIPVTPGFLKNKTRLIICVPRKSTHMPE
jgi:hypothetical protein